MPIVHVVKTGVARYATAILGDDVDYLSGGNIFLEVWQETAGLRHEIEGQLPTARLTCNKPMVIIMSA